MPSSDAATEAELIRHCQDGDLSAFAGLYERSVDQVYAFIFHKVLNRETAEDLVSETFFKALDHIRSYKADKASFRTWLFAIARNTVTDYYRTRREHVDLEDVWDLSAEDDVVTSVEMKLLFSKLQKHMQLLSAEQREILTLRFWQEFSFPEIAEILGKSEASVKMAARRAVKNLEPHFTGFLLLFFILSSSSL